MEGPPPCSVHAGGGGGLGGQESVFLDFGSCLPPFFRALFFQAVEAVFANRFAFAASNRCNNQAWLPFEGGRWDKLSRDFSCEFCFWFNGKIQWLCVLVKIDFFEVYPASRRHGDGIKVKDLLAMIGYGSPKGHGDVREVRVHHAKGDADGAHL